MSGYPGIFGVFLLDRQQVTVPLPGFIKTVATRAAQGAVFFGQRRTAQRADPVGFFHSFSAFRFIPGLPYVGVGLHGH